MDWLSFDKSSAMYEFMACWRSKSNHVGIAPNGNTIMEHVSLRDIVYRSVEAGVDTCMIGRGEALVWRPSMRPLQPVCYVFGTGDLYW